MEWLRSWLLSITCAAMIAALADALCPGGFPRKLIRSAGGLLLLLAVLGPIKQLDSRELSGILAKYQAQYGGYAETVAEENQGRTKAIIERQTAAYISDKAAALGIEEAQVWVTCRLTQEGFPAPQSVKVRGRGDETAWDSLSRAITADFALEPEAQTLERTDVP